MTRICPPIKFDRALERFDANRQDGLAELAELATKYAKDPKVRHAFGTALMSVGAHWDALDHLEWAERNEPTLEMRRALVAAYRFLAMPEHARRIARREPSLADAHAGPPKEALPEAMSSADRLTFERARTAALHGEDAALDDLRALADRFPSAMPLLNMLATARYALGDMPGYADASRAAMEADPHDIHALLNATRLAVLREGIEGAAAFRERVLAASSTSAGIIGGDLARAEALAMMDDAEGVRAAVDAWRASVERPEEAEGSAIADRLQAYLDVRAEEPRAPLVRLEALLLGYLRRWSGAPRGLRMSEVARELADLPGVFALAPRTIGFESERMVSVLAHVLLSEHAPPPPEDSWASVLRSIVADGPGERSPRMHLRGILEELGLAEAPVAFDVQDDETSPTRLQLFHEPVSLDLSERDQARYLAAMDALMASNPAAARAELQELHARYPNAVGVEFNLALTERLSGGEAAETAKQRLERIAREHPTYLFAKAQLGSDAIEAGELDRARELLALPEGATRFHVLAFADLHAAQGRLALAQGEMATVEQILASLRDLVGEDAPPYRRLLAAVQASDMRRAVPGSPGPAPEA